jgi:hypothetical protein
VRRTELRGSGHVAKSMASVMAHHARRMIMEPGVLRTSPTPQRVGVSL